VADDDAGTVPPYPRHWEADVVLRDGGTAHVRPIRPEDGDALQAFHVGQSERSTYFRFFAPLERLPDDELRRFTHVDHVDRVALVAVIEEDGVERIIAVARYDRTGPDTAEVAFNVADAHHGRGLGSVLLEHLAAAARERGIHRFTAEVLPQNGRMLAVFREAGYGVEQRLDDGIVWVSFDVDPTERSLAVMADREHRAEARSVLGMLTPSSVLVVTEEGGPDHPAACAVVRHLLDAPGRHPQVHVVGWPQAPEPARSWPGPERVEASVDLLVLGVPAARCAEVVRRCARLRPHAVVVLSAGFAETGPEGLAHQRELLRAAHAVGARVLGPGSYGFLRHGQDDAATVNASLSARMPEPGRLGLLCQSAPMAVGLLASARRRGLGLSTFVSSGHRADVSGNDLMQFWTQDPATDVVAAYLESIGNPRKFVRVARRLAATKPVVVLTAGSSGHVAPAGHVLRGTRVPRRVLDDLLRQSGVVRATSQHHLLDVAQLLVHQPLPAGARVTVLAGSEPMAALVAEAATSAGLVVTSRRAILATGESTAEDLARLDADLRDAYADPATDVAVVAYVPTLGPPHPQVARSVARAAAASGKTTVACLRGLSGVTAELTATAPDGTVRTVPAYAAPEDGVAALAAAVRYARWRGADHGRPLAPAGIDRAAAAGVVARALAGTAGVDRAEVVRLDPDDTAALLGAYGIEVWPVRLVRTEDEAVAAAEELGWPVALKSLAGNLRHRIDLGGVRLDVTGPQALRDAMAQVRRVLAQHCEPEDRFEVQRMAPAGAACVIRSSEDPRFGPVVSFGLAGDASDLLDDVVHRVAPLTDVDVAEMVRGVRAAPRLFGYRGSAPLDVAALEDVLARVAVLAEDVPEVHDLELHPVVVGERGAAVLAARVELAEAERVDGTRRALP
jgi:acyl-CoA synthetase (NDP forming)/RimJ/RimL family protein N-acetyltransferase